MGGDISQLAPDLLQMIWFMKTVAWAEMQEQGLVCAIAVARNPKSRSIKLRLDRHERTFLAVAASLS